MTAETTDAAGNDTPPPLSDKDKFELLARKLIWALKYLKAPGSGTMCYGLNDPKATEIKTVYWVDDFCDALDQCGIKIDRAALDLIRSPRKTKSSKRIKP
jgi:hypothetical protein